MSLPQHCRIAGKQSFTRVLEQPVVSADTAFRVLARPNGLAHARLGMAVSRKIDTRAVVRNRIKRIIRESFRAHYCNRRSTAADILVFPRPGAAALSNQGLFASLAGHWLRINRRLESFPTTAAGEAASRDLASGARDEIQVAPPSNRRRDP